MFSSLEGNFILSPSWKKGRQVNNLVFVIVEENNTGAEAGRCNVFYDKNLDLKST